MPLFDKLDDYLLQYGVPTAVGAGLGFLTGGPVGAVIGGATGLGSTIAGPRVAQALPEGTPEEIRKAVEYGIYGFGGGLGVGAAVRGGAKVALTQLLSKKVLQESAKLAAGTAAGAVAGEKLAKAVGLPSTMGELAGSVVGPFAPGVARGLRTRAFLSDNEMFRGIASALGANEANSVKRARTTTTATIDGGKVVGSSADAAAVARREAARKRATIEELHAQLSDAEVQALTGVQSPNPREYLLARARNQLPPELAGAVTEVRALRQAQRRLAALNKQWANRTAVEEKAQALFDEVRQQLPGVDGQLVDDEVRKVFIWKGADGSETAVPDALAEKFQRASQVLDKARARRAEVETKLKELLGAEAVPETPEGRLDVLRRKFLGEEAAAIDAALMPPETARRALRLVQAADYEQALGYQRRRAALLDDAARHEALADFLEANPQLGAPAPGLLAQAARALAAIRSSEELLAAAGRMGRRFIELPRVSLHTFEDYAKVAQFIAQAEPTPARYRAKLQSLLNPTTLRGTVWEATPEGPVIPRRVLRLDLNRGTAHVVSQFQREAVADEIPLSALRIGYTFDQLKELSRELDLASQLYVGMPHPRTGLPMTADDVAQLRQALPKAEPQGEPRRLWATRRDYERAVRQAEATGRPPPSADGFIDEDIAKAWEQFNSNFMGAGAILETKALTPEWLDKQARGLRNLIGRTPRPSANPIERMVFVENAEFMRQGREAIEGAYLAVEDREILEQIGVLARDNPTDPRLPVLLMLEQSVSDIKRLVNDAQPGFRGAVGQFLERHGAGILVRHPQGKAILQNYAHALEYAANFVGGTYQVARVVAAREAAARLGRAGSLREGLRAARRALPSPGKAVAAFVENIAPISRERELQMLLRREFRPEGLPAPMRARWNAMTDAQRDVATQWLTSQFRIFVEYPEAFPGIANDPKFQAIRNYWTMHDQILAREMHLMHVPAQTRARRMSMLVSREVRDMIAVDRLEQEYPLLELFDQVWQAVGGDPQKAARALVYGADADMAWAMAGYQSIAVQRVVEKLQGLAKPDERITPDDIIFRGGNWIIRSKNKWPRELHDTLRGLEEILSGRHKWEGLQQLSQKIAMGNLAVDLSVLGVQGFKYAAHSLLAGRPMRAAQVLAEGLTHIVTDYGFYAWMRQNLDEIMYYTSLGLMGGLKGHIAGPPINKVALEHLPYVGNAIGKLYGLTDLQYNRALFYWKVQAVRDNLEFARTLRAVRGQVADKFLADVVGASPMAKAVADDMGGLEAYLLGSTEDTVKAVIRQINRAFGGVNLEAEGVGAYRRAAEQILTVVPGFFRGQVGQWAAILTKPHTLEGHLALSMLAREYMFAGMIATGFARMLGTEEKINWTDPSTSTWLGIPLPDEFGGGTISLLPTMAIPRLASRVVRETVDAATGEGADFDTALEAFAHGRLSPIVGAFYDNIRGEDFLGRKYDSQLEKWGATLSGMVLPVIMQSAIEDIQEEIKHARATGEFNLGEVALSTGLELFGKGLVPQHPSERLNRLAIDAYGTEWNLLTDAEKAELRRSNPAVAAAEAEYDFYTRRRAGTRESYVDRQYKQYQANVDAVWTEPMSINGIVSTQAQDDEWVAQGVITGDTWRERYHVRQQAAAQWYKALQQDLAAEGIDVEEVREERLRRLEENRPEDRAVLLQLARAEYAGVEPPTEQRVVVTPAGEVTLEVVNWDEFFAQREAVLNKYPVDMRDAIRRSARADENPGILAYQQASQKQREIEALGRYRGLSAEQSDKLDRMRSIITRVGEMIRGQTGLQAGAVPQRVIQQAALQEMMQSGVVRSDADLQLATLAFTMARNEKLAAAMQNPAQVAAILNNPDVVLFYPYLRFRVPRQLWPQLPAQIFQAELVEAQLTM